MQNIFPKQNFSCLTDYALETINSIDLKQITYFFDNLICDQYLKDNYRFRRLSRFKVNERPCSATPRNFESARLALEWGERAPRG
ncbi:MAG: 2OG-Fe dioxygenase family protein, partial [Xenococcus sp. (in: cyanobacteria)]